MRASKAARARIETLSGSLPACVTDTPRRSPSLRLHKLVAPCQATEVQGLTYLHVICKLLQPVSSP
jgi:hypothetical protein